MGHEKINHLTATNDIVTVPQDVLEHVEALIKNSKENVIVFDLQGKVISMSQKAISLFGSQPVPFYLSELYQLNTYARKRQFLKAKTAFLSTQPAIIQQFNWIETEANKPIQAFNVLLNKVDVNGTDLVFAQLKSIIQEKMSAWVLNTLNNIGHEQTTHALIDDITQLMSSVFSGYEVSVNLFKNKSSVHSISYFLNGKKQDNVSYSLEQSPSQRVLNSKKTCYFTEVQALFPDDTLLKNRSIHTYIGGPICNSQAQVVGLLTLVHQQRLSVDHEHQNLLTLFLQRVNFEIERLLTERKLEFMTTIPLHDPNPILRVLPSGAVIYANTSGKILLQKWNKRYSGLPDRLLKEVRNAEATNQVIRIEMETDTVTYLFTLLWVSEFNHINIYASDISQLQSTEQNMLNIAHYDALTQIANRQYFEETFIERIHEHLLDSKDMALMLIDFDEFKLINETLGHSMGDQVLKAAATRLARCIGEEDFIARLGGDEFIILLHHSNSEAATKVAEKVISVLSRFFHFGEYQIKLSASIGISSYPADGVTTSELLKNADIAMNQAKKAGRNTYAQFTQTWSHIKDQRNEKLRDDLKLAAARNELYVDYQPQIELATNKIVGIEAFLRWTHPELGLILPNEFINIAEQSGSIHIISQWLIERALQDFASLVTENSEITLSMNISLSQLNDARFLDSLSDNLFEFNVSKHKIILDISERTIAPHYKQLIQVLKQIHAFGFKICLDSFGSPQLPLPKLLALPIDILKLDQNLLRHIDKSDKHKMLLTGIISIATSFGLDVVQKGIETEEQNAMIKAMGCQFAQGFYYCPPMAINDLRHFIIDYTAMNSV